MEQEIELSDYTFITDNVKTPERTGMTNHQSERPGRRLPALWVVALGLLCLTQAVLNVSLRLGSYSKEKLSQPPANSSGSTDLCCSEKSQETVSCSCYNNLLRKYQTLEKDRDRLRQQLSQLKQLEGISSGSVPPDLENFSSDTHLELFDDEMSQN